MNLDKDIVERLAKDNHILANPVYRGATWYEVQHIDHLLAFAKDIIELTQSDEPACAHNDKEIAALEAKNKQLVEALSEIDGKCESAEHYYNPVLRDIEKIIEQAHNITAHKE